MTISIFRQKSREVLETRLLDEGLDFSASYMAVKDIRSNLEAIPETLTRQTFDSISRTLLSRIFDKQKQAFFLHREIVQTLVSAPFIHNSPFKADSIRFLRGLLFNGNRDKKRAIYESLGSLDLKHDCRRFGIEPCRRAPELSVDAIFKKLGALNPEAAYWKGRSLLQIQPDGGICAVKFAKSGEEALKLNKEAVWMTRFDNFSMPSGLRFDPPSPLAVQGRPLFAIRNGYKGFSHAIAYTAPADYFDYPNCTGIIQKYSKERIRDVFSRNAWLLGKLASMGVIHTAVIPLFHNRVQQDRREDLGHYDWEHGGRLDQWLESCRYPNIAFSGLRDFEHLDCISRTSKLRRHIGEHLLSLILIAGSFFRNQDPELKGYDNLGNPVDARHLFDVQLLEGILHDIICHYGTGFTGNSFSPENQLCDEIKALSGELVQAMGVDNHMEEVLRLEDQNRLDDESFRKFLASRGVRPDEIGAYESRKGTENLSISTGPHLGGFNQAISVPRLIDLLFTLSALFISNRYLTENGFTDS